MTDDKLYTSLSANTIMAILTNYVQQTRLITSSTDKHHSLDSEDDFRSGFRTSVTNNSSFQNYTHPDDHTIRTADTPGFKPFTIKPLSKQPCNFFFSGWLFWAPDDTDSVWIFTPNACSKFFQPYHFKMVSDDTTVEIVVVCERMWKPESLIMAICFGVGLALETPTMTVTPRIYWDKMVDEYGTEKSKTRLFSWVSLQYE